MREGHFVVDAHVHVIRGAIDSTFAEPSGRASRSPAISAEEVVARMERYGIDTSVLIVHAWSDTSIDEVRHEHDIVAEDIRRYPERFTGVCTADPRQGQRAVDEVRRAVEELGYCGLKLLPSFHNYLVDSALVDPLMRVAADSSLPVLYCSQWHFYGAEPWRWVRLARRYPELTFVMCHMGIDPFVTESLVVPHMVAEAPNIVLETSATTTDPYGVFTAPAEILGPDRLMWGSDGGPFLHPELELLKLDLAGLEPGAKRMVLGGTAARVFGIAQPNPL
ncbi:MAG TPA: hypothetical protein DEP84_10515 [Chloroflexi bacterium]|nr:hypothetical protein [Chloroflexota bacterium]